MQIKDALENLGLNKKQSLVYVALVKLGKATAYAVAEEAGVKRPTAYVVLGELMQKGLVNKFPREKKQIFAAKPPDELFAEAEERMRLAQSALPELLAIATKRGPQFRTLYYEGEKGLREMLDLINQKMKGKEIMGFYAKVSPEGKHLEDYFHKLNEDRKKLDIKLRGMTPSDPSLEWYRKRIKYFGNQFKYINPKDYSSDCSIEIGDYFIQIISMRHLQGVHMENPDVASTMRQIFEMVWHSRPEKTEGTGK